MLFLPTRYLKATFDIGTAGCSIFSSVGSARISCRRLLSRFVNGLTSSRIESDPPWKVLFFGTDDYALDHLKKLHENCVAGDFKLVKSLEVVTPKINKCAVGQYAADNNLPCYQWPIPTMVDRYDVGVVVSFGHLIPQRVIETFPYGILNVHPSILPRWRGASPIIHTILNGDRETGISIMEIRPIHFDVGPLLLQSKFLVPDDCTTLQLRHYLAVEGSFMLLHALKELPRLEKLEYEQKGDGITYAHKLSLENARVNWEKQTLQDIDRQYRALSEIYGLRSLWNGHKVRLLDMVPIVEMQEVQDKLDESYPEDEMSVRPGIPHFLESHDLLCVRCKDTWAGFRGIVLKKQLSAKSFFNGYLSKPHLNAVAFESQENGLDKHIFDKTVPTSNKKRDSLISNTLSMQFLC